VVALCCGRFAREPDTIAADSPTIQPACGQHTDQSGIST
jgi:hypothetical protein